MFDMNIDIVVLRNKWEISNIQESFKFLCPYGVGWGRF